MLRTAWTTAALGLALAACWRGPPLPPVSAISPEARRIAEGALFAEQGFDALQAFELRGFEQPILFAVARKWKGAGVRVLSYVVEPEASKGTAFLLLREPGERPELFSYLGGQLRQGNVALRIAANSEISVAAEVVQPILAGDFRYQQLADETLEGQACSVIDAWPVQRLRGVTHLRLHVSRAHGMLVRKTYMRREHALRRVRYHRAKGADVQGRRPTERWTIEAPGEAGFEIRLHNQLADPELPDALFTPYQLEKGRFPRF